MDSSQPAPLLPPCRAHKFGGSSLADAERIRHVAGLLLADDAPRQLAVSSAMHGTTNALVALADAAPFLLAVGPIGQPGEGLAHATQKTSALAVSGWARSGDQHFDLHDAVASLDSSHGLLAHRTAWQWACAHRHGIQSRTA